MLEMRTEALRTEQQIGATSGYQPLLLLVAAVCMLGLYKLQCQREKERVGQRMRVFLSCFPIVAAYLGYFHPY